MTKYRKPFDAYVDAGPTRARLAELYAAGATVRGIAAATGLTPSGVSGIRRPDQTRVQQRTADLILALTLRDAIAASPGRISAIGTRRRIKALMALGWRHEDLQAHSGISTHMIIGAPASRKARWVEVETHRAILDTYDALWDQAGPSERTRRHAAKRGWAPPLAWDDDSIDDPAATPHGVGVSTIGHIGVHEDDLRDFAKWGMTTGQAAERLRIKRDSLITRFARIGDPDLTAAFARNDADAAVAA